MECLYSFSLSRHQCGLKAMCLWILAYVEMAHTDITLFAVLEKDCHQQSTNRYSLSFGMFYPTPLAQRMNSL